jgi:N-acetylmuramoyl-L-alanine amidase
MLYLKDHIPRGKLRPGTKMTPATITIHSTGNPKSTARNERGWLTNPANDRIASWHICVDEKEAVEAIPLDEVAYHAGSKTGNNSSIGIEICESGNREKTLVNAVKLVAKMLHERSWGVDRLRRHYDWSGKICPRIMSQNNWDGWKQFVERVRKELENMELKPAKVLVDGQECEAYIIKGKTFVEVRKPFEQAGFKVNYNSKTQVTEITK